MAVRVRETTGQYVLQGSETFPQLTGEGCRTERAAGQRGTETECKRDNRTVRQQGCCSRTIRQSDAGHQELGTCLIAICTFKVQ